MLPLLAHELQVEDETKRLAALDLLGKLFTLPGSDMDQEYGYLFEDFLRRCKDQKVGLMTHSIAGGKAGEMRGLGGAHHLMACYGLLKASGLCTFDVLGRV